MNELNIEEMMTESNPLADIPTEGTPFTGESDEQEVPVESPTENIETEESPSQEGEETEESTEEVDETSEETEVEDTPDDNEKLPFHKNPRWQKMQEDKKALEAEVAELKSMTEKVSQLEQTVQGMDKGTEVPAEFKEVFGENVEAYNNWQKLQQGQRDGIKKEIIAELAQAQKAEQEAVTKQQDAIQENITYIEDQYDVKLPEKSSLRNEYMKFMLDYQPTTDGNLDFSKGWELFGQVKGTKTDNPISKARKKVVAKTASDRKAETPESDVYELGNILPNQFKKR